MDDKNRMSWNLGAARYSEKLHTDAIIGKIISDPSAAFHHTTWEVLNRYVPNLRGKRVCVPSSGDNHAVFAFAKLGASVVSCDFAENQLANASRAADRFGLSASIEFRCEDTRDLAGLPDDEFDLVYTSNGVHVWIDDLAAMYRSVHRVLKPGGTYIMYEIHPFQRPFDDNARVVKPYDAVGPFDNGKEITYAWRMMDILNAITDSGLRLGRIEEMYAEKDYDSPFWIELGEQLSGKTVSREEVDKMYDWLNNPMAALPNWLCAAAVK